MFRRLIAVGLLLGTLSACDPAGTTTTASFAQSVRNAGPNSAFLYRDTGLFAAAVNFEISVDGRPVGLVGNKKALEFQLPPGTRNIKAIVAASYGKNPVALDVQVDPRKPHFFILQGSAKIVPLVVVTVSETSKSLVEVDQQAFLEALP